MICPPFSDEVQPDVFVCVRLRSVCIKRSIVNSIAQHAMTDVAFSPASLDV